MEGTLVDGAAVAPAIDQRLTSRELNSAHIAARARERRAWEYLEHMREAGTREEREQFLRRWQDAMHELRALQTALHASIAREASGCLKQWLSMTGESEQVCTVPLRQGQRLRARDGSIWWIESAALDAFEPGHFLAHIRRGPSNTQPGDTLELYGDDWPLICHVHGLSALND